MATIKHHEEFDTTDALGLNLLQLVYQMADVVCGLKEIYCLHDSVNEHYGDTYRSTMVPATCGCSRDDCKINPLVRDYKATLAQFDALWPDMGYVMLL